MAELVRYFYSILEPTGQRGPPLPSALHSATVQNENSEIVLQEAVMAVEAVV